jgi:DegV family protein with EDD domain
MLRIVTDGAADMPPEWEKTYAINILPLHVNFGEEGYTQGPGFTNADFYRMVNEKKIIPKTSLPSIGQIKEYYRSIAQAGDTILSIHISSRLSGTYATVETAARELADEFKIVVFDSLAGSAAQAFLAREARLLDRAGAALPEIIACLEGIRRRIAIIFTIDTLDYAYLSGRIGALQSLIASALKVKPIIVLREGLLDIAERVRTRQRSIDHVMTRLKERFDDRRVNIAVVHAADPQAAQSILSQVKRLLNVNEAILTELAIPVAANLGPGAIGVIGYTVEEERP